LGSDPTASFPGDEVEVKYKHYGAGAPANQSRRSAAGIMATGHVNRIYRPNTWLRRPMLLRRKKVLANAEPSTHGPRLTSSYVRRYAAVET